MAGWEISGDFREMRGYRFNPSDTTICIEGFINTQSNSVISYILLYGDNSGDFIIQILPINNLTLPCLKEVLHDSQYRYWGNPNEIVYTVIAKNTADIESLFSIISSVEIIDGSLLDRTKQHFVWIH